MSSFLSLTLCIANHMRMVKQSAQLNVAEKIPWLSFVLKITNTLNQNAVKKEMINESCFEVLRWVPVFWLCQRWYNILTSMKADKIYQLCFCLWCIYTLQSSQSSIWQHKERGSTSLAPYTPVCVSCTGGMAPPLLPLLTLLHLTASSLYRKCNTKHRIPVHCRPNASMRWLLLVI